ncbi:peptidylprolyl isomerase fpr4 [Podila clonocystis]|nr:peptidylprolyl isomerase fpr4 [Podila clonocystis]
MLGFWGLTVLPDKTYRQVVENSFKLSMAALDETTKPGRSSVRVTVDKKTFVLCSLAAGKTEQQTLDLVFTEGEEITFSVSGENTVHLSGNYLPEEDFGSDEDMYDDEDDMEDDMEEDDDEEDDEEGEENVIVTKGAKRVAQFEEKTAPAKKQAKVETPVKKEEVKKEAKKQEAKKEAKKEIKKEEPKKEVKKEAKKEKEAPKKEEPKKTVLASGLVIEDVKVGTGAAAKSGKKIGMRYIGRLTNGKVFDKNTSGQPFHFNLGRGEVIKGWDQGIQGMQLGGERRLTIPPALAYGARGAPPDIPKNATLVFEVKLVTLK